MKTQDLLILGAVALGGYLLLKWFSGSNGAGGGGGGLDNGETKENGIIPPPPQTDPYNPAAPVLSRGAVIFQQPVRGISYNDPRNLVLTQPNVRSGQVTVVPITQPKPPAKRIIQPPLKIQTITGFPVVPKLAPITPPTVYKETSSKYHMGR